jgi:hypothetical protein
VEAQAPLVARLLRGEVAPLARDEVAEALARRLAYRPDDVVVVDVDAALIVDRAHDDTLAVLDFANCEHLALRTLDDELDAAVAGASALLGSRLRRLRTRWSPGGRALRRLTELTLAAAAELEAVDNAIKLTGDHYLARVYRLAVDRFHLRPFREGIARKLATLWEVQRVLLDQAAARRAELLEWIIIALIAVELARSVG